MKRNNLELKSNRAAFFTHAFLALLLVTTVNCTKRTQKYEIDSSSNTGSSNTGSSFTSLCLTPLQAAVERAQAGGGVGENQEVLWKVQASGCTGRFRLVRLGYDPVDFTDSVFFSTSYSGNQTVSETVTVVALDENGNAVDQVTVTSESMNIDPAIGIDLDCWVLVNPSFADILVDAEGEPLESFPEVNVSVFSSLNTSVAMAALSAEGGDFTPLIPIVVSTEQGMVRSAVFTPDAPDFYAFGATVAVDPLRGPSDVCFGTFSLQPIVQSSCTLTSSAAIINLGQSVTLTLQSSGDTNTYKIDDTDVAKGETLARSPTARTTYTATVNGPGGEATCEVEVRVRNRRFTIYRNTPSSRCNGGSAYESTTRASYGACNYSYRDDCWGNNPGSNGNIKAEMNAGTCRATGCRRRSRWDDGDYRCQGISTFLRYEWRE